MCKMLVITLPTNFTATMNIHLTNTLLERILVFQIIKCIYQCNVKCLFLFKLTPEREFKQEPEIVIEAKQNSFWCFFTATDPVRLRNGQIQFLKRSKLQVYLYTMLVFVFVTLLIYVLARFSPNQWEEPPNCIRVRYFFQKHEF